MEPIPGWSSLKRSSRGRRSRRSRRRSGISDPARRPRGPAGRDGSSRFWRRFCSSPPGRCRVTKLLELFATRRSARRRPRRWRLGAGQYAGEDRGILVEDVAGGVRLATRPEVVGWLRRFFDVSAGNKLSMAALETLAIIAYRQPMTGPEIQELRGVSAAGVLKTLLERRLVRIVGRKEVVGKPFLYGTTREFLVHFGLNSLKDLPPPLESSRRPSALQRRQRRGRPRQEMAPGLPPRPGRGGAAGRGPRGAHPARDRGRAAGRRLA